MEEDQVRSQGSPFGVDYHTALLGAFFCWDRAGCAEKLVRNGRL